MHFQKVVLKETSEQKKYFGKRFYQCQYTLLEVYTTQKLSIIHTLSCVYAIMYREQIIMTKKNYYANSSVFLIKIVSGLTKMYYLCPLLGFSFAFCTKIKKYIIKCVLRCVIGKKNRDIDKSRDI